MRLYQFHHRQLRYKIHHIIIYLFTDPVLIPVTFNTFFQKFFCHFQIFCNFKPVLAAMLKGSYQSDQTDLFVVRPKPCLTFLLCVNPETGKWEDIETKAMTGETLYKILCTQERKYGCKFLFCDKKDTGKEIIRILSENGGAK